MKTIRQAITCVALISLTIIGPAARAEAKAEYENSITYLGATWGPDGDTVYCLKQIVFRKKLTGNPLEISKGMEKPGSSIWFCKMNWDGTHKVEIAELWPGQSPYVDTQGGPIWMEVNGVSSQVVFGVEYGVKTVGIWMMGLDGKNLHRPFVPTLTNAETHTEEKLIAEHPSWNPDGTKLVFCEHGNGKHLAIYDLVEKEHRQLTDGPMDEHPVWSPKGDWIVFTHSRYERFEGRKRFTEPPPGDSGRNPGDYTDRCVWLIKAGGSEQKPVGRPQG